MFASVLSTIKQKHAILLTTHDMEVAELCADRVGIMVKVKPYQTHTLVKTRYRNP